MILVGRVGRVNEGLAALGIARTNWLGVPG